MLSEYLSGREKEVVDIMMTLFNEEYILKTYVESREKEASENTKIETVIIKAKPIRTNFFSCFVSSPP